MVVHYVHYGFVRTSARWRTVLRAADKAGVRFTVTSGHRTLREQWALFRLNMQLVHGRWVQKPGRPLTAFPTPRAPHIATGRRNHALDVDSLDGGEARLQQWLEAHGAHPTNPVPGEPWHMQISGGDLARLYRKFR